MAAGRGSWRNIFLFFYFLVLTGRKRNDKKLGSRANCKFCLDLQLLMGLVRKVGFGPVDDRSDKALEPMVDRIGGP